jgi:hypothetical protein
MKFRPSCSDWFKKVCTKIKRSADIHNSTAPTDFDNHLAVRPAPRGAAGGAGGGPPCIKLRLLLKYCKKKATTAWLQQIGVSLRESLGEYF